MNYFSKYYTTSFLLFFSMFLIFRLFEVVLFDQVNLRILNMVLIDDIGFVKAITAANVGDSIIILLNVIFIIIILIINIIIIFLFNYLFIYVGNLVLAFQNVFYSILHKVDSIYMDIICLL